MAEVNARAGIAWLESWAFWKADVSAYLVSQLETCPDVPQPPPRFARAAEIGQGACVAEDLPEALTVLERADAAVEKGLLLQRSLPWSRTRGRSRVEPRLSSVASLLVDWDVEVRCWNRGEWPIVSGELDEYLVRPIRDLAGFAWYSQAHLNGDWCDVLADFPMGRAAVDEDDAFALDLLAHEAAHVGIGGTEAQVECFALQHIRQAASLLGAPRWLARGLPQVVWEDYPYLAPSYRSRECREGGALDETPNDGVWP
jgi:hypothetical protein